MTNRQRAALRHILAYSFSTRDGYSTRSYEACDIPTRAEISRLVQAIGKVFEPRPRVRGTGYTLADIGRPRR